MKNPLVHPVVTSLATKVHEDARADRAPLAHRAWTLGDSEVSAAQRIAENIDIFDFQLTADEVASIDALDTGVRGGPDPDLVDAEMFPLTIPD